MTAIVVTKSAAETVKSTESTSPFVVLSAWDPVALLEIVLVIVFPKVPAFIVAEINGKHVGYVMCKTEYGFSNFKKLGFVKKGHVVSIAVLEEYRKRGIGKAIVEESTNGIKLKKCDEFYLEVRCSNTEAVRLYEKLGFIIKQQLNAYYRDGEDAYLMAIEFDK